VNNSGVSTSGRGCVSDKGLGKGVLIGGCSASGASHGGLGGWGSSDD
jgi:hypothetical protein